MTNHKSAEKRLKQSIKRRASNRSAKSAIRTAMKKVREGVASGNLDEAKKLAKSTEALLASANKKGILHGGNVRRNISKMAKLVSKKVG